jgi:hypothetical protein
MLKSRQYVRKHSDGEILKLLPCEREFAHLLENASDLDFTSLAFGYIGSLSTSAAVRIISMNSRYLPDIWILHDRPHWKPRADHCHDEPKKRMCAQNCVRLGFA